MKRSDFCNIASYKDLRVAQRENCKALKRKKDDIHKHGMMLAEALSPTALMGNLMRYFSPLQTLYDFFRK